MLVPKTVVELARRRAGFTQQQLAHQARTQQSSISEYESRQKSPTLDVVERLMAAADFELAFRPVIDFEVREDPDLGSYLVPEKLWSVPMPDCFSKVQVAGMMFKSNRTRVWDLSVESERIAYYEWAIVHGIAELMLDSVDGVLLMQGWDRLEIPEVIRAAWQPVIDTATLSQETSPRDPGGFSAWITKETGVAWRPVRKRKQRQPQKSIPRVSRDSPVSVVRRYLSSTD